MDRSKKQIIKHFVLKNHSHMFEDDLAVKVCEENDTIQFEFSDHYHGNDCYYRSDKHVNKEKE